MTSGERQQGRPRFERAVVRHLLELHGKEEERAPERGVHDEGHGVGGAELPAAEDRQREHGIPLARLRDHEGDEEQHRPKPACPGRRARTSRRSGASMSPPANPTSASVTSVAPSTSTGPAAAGSLVSGTWRRAMTTTTTASGRLMRKMSRHDTALMRNPPAKGPMAVATPPRPDQAPMARHDRPSRTRPAGWPGIPG